jgi:hypothetical protein
VYSKEFINKNDSDISVKSESVLSGGDQSDCKNSNEAELLSGLKEVQFVMNECKWDTSFNIPAHFSCTGNPGAGILSYLGSLSWDSRYLQTIHRQLFVKYAFLRNKQVSQGSDVTVASKENFFNMSPPEQEACFV